jgi:MoaA/NifB/PqqE/SkfB family radical SAM enzyme
MVRDREYAPWLKELGVEIVQLSLFGTEENTDYFRGRKGAYKEHMQAIDILIEKEIVPRIQIFPFSTTIDDINGLYHVLQDIRLEERVIEMGKEFPCFLNTTAPMGAGFDLEDIRLRRSDLRKLPEYLIGKTLEHYQSASMDTLWKTESELLPELLGEDVPLNEESEILAFMVDSDFNVYPNFGEIAEWWCLGNVKKDGVGTIIDNFIGRNTPGMKMNFEIPVSYFAKKYGKRDNERLWAKVDLVQKWHRLEAMNNREAYI